MIYRDWYLSERNMCLRYYPEPTTEELGCTAAIVEDEYSGDPLLLSTYSPDPDEWVTYREDIDIFSYFQDVINPTDEEKLAFKLEFGIDYPPTKLVTKYLNLIDYRWSLQYEV